GEPVVSEGEAKVSERQRELLATEREEEAQMGRWLRAVVGRYEWLLGRALDNRLLVVVVCLAVMVFSYLIYRGLGSEFLPEFDEGAFVLDYFTPPGTSLTETDRILKHVEKMLQENEDVESYSRRTGLQLGLSVTEPNTGDFLVKLKDNRKHKTEDVKDDLRKEIANTEPNLSRVELPGILGDLIGDLTGSPQPIEIKLFSEDTAALRQKAKEVAEVLEKMSKTDMPGIVDIDDGVTVTVSGPAVTARLEGIDLGSAIRAIQARLAREVKLPPGMTVEYGGLYREQQSSFRELMLSLALAVALVFVTLLVEFRSFSHPVAILTGAVLALSGVLAALFFTRTTLNVVSLMGMIMVIGIVAKNGILMLDA